MKVELSAIEYALPDRVEDAFDLQEAQPCWPVASIRDKTGVDKRYLAAPDDTTESLAHRAAGKLLDKLADRAEIGFLIVVTQSPDQALPPVASLLHARLGLSTRCAAFDINLGCSGFVYALAVGASLIESGLAQRGLIVCSERYSRYVAEDDRTCRPLFSDGAAATLISHSESDRLGPFDLGSDGAGAPNIMVTDGRLTMNGAQVLMFTMQAVPVTVEQVLSAANVKAEDVDLFVFHQASRIVIDNLVRRLDLPEEKVFINYDRIGNTVSASIPIALKQAAEEGRLKPGALVLLVGFGVGYSWGSCLVRWTMVAAPDVEESRLQEFTIY
jgi:3-oxoacyl-[acyl-carrier-protein] synthase-3